MRPGPQLLKSGGDVVRKRDTETAAVLAQPALPARRDVPVPVVEHRDELATPTKRRNGLGGRRQQHRRQALAQFLPHIGGTVGCTRRPERGQCRFCDAALDEHAPQHRQIRAGRPQDRLRCEHIRHRKRDTTATVDAGAAHDQTSDAAREEQRTHSHSDGSYGCTVHTGTVRR
jgi:hypothetical protein